MTSNSTLHQHKTLPPPYADQRHTAAKLFLLPASHLQEATGNLIAKRLESRLEEKKEKPLLLL
eukprot:2397230-Pyramimonas_sp.AAC.1